MLTFYDVRIAHPFVTQKNVEKKRRETINNGIERIANQLPPADRKTNKSQILEAAATYIMELKRIDNENSQRWLSEKAALDSSLESAKRDGDYWKTELLRLQNHNAVMRQALDHAGITSAEEGNSLIVTMQDGTRLSSSSVVDPYVWTLPMPIGPSIHHRFQNSLAVTS